MRCTEWHPVFVVVAPLHCAVLSSCLSTELSGWFLDNVEFNYPKLENLSCDFFNDQTWFLWHHTYSLTYLLFLSLLELESGFSFDCTVLPVLMVSSLVASPFVCPFFSLLFLNIICPFFSEMSSIFERDRLFSFTCGPFLLFIKKVIGQCYQVLVLEKSDRMVDHATSPGFMCYCAQGQRQRDYRFGMHV